VIATWDRLVARADNLAAADGPAAALLAFYAALLRSQRGVLAHLSAERGPSGQLECDGDMLRARATVFLRELAQVAPAPLARDARARLDAGAGVLDDELRLYWQSPSSDSFFAKALMQPYFHWLAACGAPPVGRGLTPAENRCPFCGGSPQLSVLHAASDADGGGRSLLCATCVTTWPYRRVRCVQCGEEDEHKLGYFRAGALDHIRLDTCEACGGYLKSVDLTALGSAAPLVDDVASAPLDLWARERGYCKSELNLVGL
jgi:formate dehydrogenase accessory protein FdhE